MKKDLIKVNVSGMTREEWLEERRKGIGGSDAGAILGLSKWSTPTTVYYDKLGELPDREESEALRIGRDLEAYVASRFEETTGKKIRKCNYILKDAEYPFLCANIDRDVVGEDAGLECKTASAYKAKTYKGGEFPETYYSQTVHYMSVTGAKRWYLAVLILGIGFKVFIMTTDKDEKKPEWAESIVYVSPDEINALRGVEIEFWTEHVEKKIPPAVDGLEPTTEAIETVSPENPKDVEIDLMGREELFQKFFDLKVQADLIEQQQTAIKQLIMQDMADATKAFCGEKYAVSYKPQSRSTFDWKAFQKANPNADLTPFFKLSTSRPLKITIKNLEE